MANFQTDILIVGGGLTGAALLLALREKGHRVLLVDNHPPSNRVSQDFDARTLALAPASINILQQLGVWSTLLPKATPIHHIHISERGQFGAVQLQGSPQAPLGYIVEMQYINQALYHLIDKQHLLAPATLVALDETKQIATFQQGDETHTVHTQILVAADGSFSTVRQLAQLNVETNAYEHDAIVANIGLKRSHGNVAYERFSQENLMAMLPMTDNRVALTWGVPKEKIEALMNLDDNAFLKMLQKIFGYRLGQFVKVGKRHVFPLQRMIMHQQANWPLVFVGNAAHTIHPVAGQGFNLGLRDVATLAQAIVNKGLNPDMLNYYSALRDSDQKSIIRITDGLIKIFTHPTKGLGLLRGLGLVAIEHVPGLKSLVAHYAGGFAGNTPDLVCGIPLNAEQGRHDEPLC